MQIDRALRRHLVILTENPLLCLIVQSVLLRHKFLALLAQSMRLCTIASLVRRLTLGKELVCTVACRTSLVSQRHVLRVRGIHHVGILVSWRMRAKWRRANPWAMRAGTTTAMVLLLLLVMLLLLAVMLLIVSMLLLLVMLLLRRVIASYCVGRWLNASWICALHIAALLLLMLSMLLLLLLIEIGFVVAKDLLQQGDDADDDGRHDGPTRRRGQPKIAFKLTLVPICGQKASQACRLQVYLCVVTGQLQISILSGLAVFLSTFYASASQSAISSRKQRWSPFSAKLRFRRLGSRDAPRALPAEPMLSNKPR